MFDGVYKLESLAKKEINVIIVSTTLAEVEQDTRQYIVITSGANRYFWTESCKKTR